MAPLADVLASARAGYWGRDPGTDFADVEVVRNGDIKANGVRWGSLPIRALTASEMAKSRIRQGDVLLTTSGDCGQVAIVTSEPEGIVCATNFVRVLRFDPALDQRYAFHFLDSAAFKNAIAPYVRGTTLKNLSTRDAFRAVQVPLPAVDEQRRIATILDQADALRAKRRQVLTRLDTLTQSIFHDMFETVEADARDSVPLGDLVSAIDNGQSPVCETRPADDGEWGVLKLGAVTYGVFRSAENKAYLGDVGALAYAEVKPGDVLMTRKNTRELVGAVAVVEQVPPRLLLPDLIFRLHLDQARVDGHYFQALMMSARKRDAVRNLSSGSAASMPNISKARLRSLPIELPPLESQRAFAARAAEVREHRTDVERSSDATDDLFASLQSRAFRGEL